MHQHYYALGFSEQDKHQDPVLMELTFYLYIHSTSTLHLPHYTINICTYIFYPAVSKFFDALPVHLFF